MSLLRNSRTRTALVVGCAALALTACAGKQKKPRLAYEERPVELLYATGADRLDRGLWNQAVQYFGEVERQHPYSEWSRRAILMTAYAHYQGNDYAEAIGDADRFISLYPGNPAAAYAHYLKAICYFEQIVDVGRDQAATGQALANLSEVVQRYPRTEYAADARPRAASPRFYSMECRAQMRRSAMTQLSGFSVRLDQVQIHPSRTGARKTAATESASHSPHKAAVAVTLSRRGRSRVAAQISATSTTRTVKKIIAVGNWSAASG